MLLRRPNVYRADSRGPSLEACCALEISSSVCMHHNQLMDVSHTDGFALPDLQPTPRVSDSLVAFLTRPARAAHFRTTALEDKGHFLERKLCLSLGKHLNGTFLWTSLAS
jgi:hypothetical protein